jgi:acetyl-CoA C-acetyltransferase
MADAYLLSAARTPIGKYLGAFADLSAPELGAVALREALSRAHCKRAWARTPRGRRR